MNIQSPLYDMTISCAGGGKTLYKLAIVSIFVAPKAIWLVVLTMEVLVSYCFVPT